MSVTLSCSESEDSFLIIALPTPGLLKILNQYKDYKHNDVWIIPIEPNKIELAAKIIVAFNRSSCEFENLLGLLF